MASRMMPSALAAIAWRIPVPKLDGSSLPSKMVIFHPIASPASLAALVGIDALSPTWPGEMIQTFFPRCGAGADVGGARSVPLYAASTCFCAYSSIAGSTGAAGAAPPPADGDAEACATEAPDAPESFSLLHPAAAPAASPRATSPIATVCALLMAPAPP